MRARLALLVSGKGCELREVVLSAKPPELLSISPKGTVPVLVTCEGRVIDQSLDIMLWVLGRHDPQGWLKPEDGSLEESLSLIATSDGEFKFHLGRYKYPDRFDNTHSTAHRDAGGIFLQTLNSRLMSRPFLSGTHPALADMAIAPFVRQFAQTDLAWFESCPWTQLHAWLYRFQDSDLFEKIMRKYPQWQSGTLGVIFPD